MGCDIHIVVTTANSDVIIFNDREVYPRLYLAFGAIAGVRSVSDNPCSYHGRGVYNDVMALLMRYYHSPTFYTFSELWDLIDEEADDETREELLLLWDTIDDLLPVGIKYDDVIIQFGFDS